MRDLKCVRVLLAAADRDIEILQLMHDSTAGPDEIFGFHAQQAAITPLPAVCTKRPVTGKWGALPNGSVKRTKTAMLHW